jgi:hypothetical protein
MPGELGNEETSNTVGHYDHLYDHRVHQPDETPKSARPGLNKKIQDMAKRIVNKHLDKDEK